MKGRYERVSLWLFTFKFLHLLSPQTHMRTLNPISKETSFCTCHKASFTLEAAVIIPLMAGFFVSILFFFRVLQIHALVEEALIYAGRKVAVESSVVATEELQFLSASALFGSYLQDEPIIEQYVEHGLLGIVLLRSNFSDEEIVLRADYKVMLPISFFGIDGIRLWNQNKFRKWVGSHPDRTEESWVYITSTGEVYHSLASCQSIALSIKGTSIEQIAGIKGNNGQKYYACSRCAEENIKYGVVYYTDYGSLYHGSLECSALKRTVSRVPLSEVSDRCPCSFCY